MIRTVPLMGTLVTIQTVRDDVGAAAMDDVAERVERAFGWFHQVEACCTRFDPRSEVMALTTRIGVPVGVSDVLFEALQFAVAVAAATDGAFDPTLGHRLEQRGFNREHRTGAVVHTDLDAASDATYRDIRVDRERKTITLLRPLVIDLGAVAKGLAIDLAARELQPLTDFAIDAGGDLYLGGRGPDGQPWSVGIRHPRQDGQLIDCLTVSDVAVCTSGDYERRSAAHGHHILDPRTGAPAGAVVSATVIAPTAMVADALATAAFVLGPRAGLRLLARQGVEGLIVSSTLERHETRGFGTAFGDPAVFRHAEGAAHHRAADLGGARRSERGHPPGRARTA